MKLTKSKLKQIIKEEILNSGLLKEDDWRNPYYDPGPSQADMERAEKEVEAAKAARLKELEPVAQKIAKNYEGQWRYLIKQMPEEIERGKFGKDFHGKQQALKAVEMALRILAKGSWSSPGCLECKKAADEMARHEGPWWKGPRWQK